jgi:uncharacterized protein YecE (DUF72 family)
MKPSRYGRFFCGTSNITLPGNKTTFPPEFQNRSRLEYYSSLFNSLEINNSFYKIPLAKTFARWGSEVGTDFLFTVKLWKGITHNKGLNYDPRDISSFMNAAAAIGDRKGCLLIQLPKSITVELQPQFGRLLNDIKSADSVRWRLAIEFRHPGWYTHTNLAMLDRVGASLVQHDMPGSEPVMLNDGADFVLMRFHGEKGDYRGSYPQPLLEARAAEIIKWLQSGKDVFAYFNNTIGDAYHNALTLNHHVQACM